MFPPREELFLTSSERLIVIFPLFKSLTAPQQSPEYGRVNGGVKPFLIMVLRALEGLPFYLEEVSVPKLLKTLQIQTEGSLYWT